MSALSSPIRFLPPISPYRAPSPGMLSPGGRRTRLLGSSEESRLRDLSPATTLQAFTQIPMPFDTSSEEYKIFACIDTLTAAERDLGARVARAAQRMQAWCSEVETWGWSGSFEEPSAEFREQRRKSIELRIREHMPQTKSIGEIPELEYWGSMLSVEVEQHESRLDEISEELLALDLEDLKEFVLNIHGGDRSRPSSAGYGAKSQSYTPMDDFDFLITQTLISALPNHFRIKEKLSTWTARVSILRSVPRYLNDLRTAQKAMQLGWEAITPPTDDSDAAFTQWKEATDTIRGVLQGKVGSLGRRLDQMLDTLEGRDDALPDTWIDDFEHVEAGFANWNHESRRRMMEHDLRRKREHRVENVKRCDAPEKSQEPSNSPFAPPLQDQTESSTIESVAQAALSTRSKIDIPTIVKSEPLEATRSVERDPVTTPNTARDHWFNRKFDRSPSLAPTSPVEPIQRTPTFKIETPTIVVPKFNPSLITEEYTYEPSREVTDDESVVAQSETELLDDGDLSFDEGGTIIHNSVEESPLPTSHVSDAQTAQSVVADSSIIISTESEAGMANMRPQTPISRRGSIESLSSQVSISSSPPSMIESPSVRLSNDRQIKVPRPALNAAMTKRRPALRSSEVSSSETPPWPPSNFSRQPTNSADDLERKISDILTTIPAHIRLTSGPEAESRDSKAGRGVTKKGSRPFLHATRSFSGMKSPELTLSPARSEYDTGNAASGRKSAAAARGNNDIKLYHLTQPGREQPIKLYIRRVGENGERVMVRVGGGWADLGEYLRQYAEHHGRRTVSDGKFEILGLEVKDPDSSPIRPESGLSRRGQTVSPHTTPVKRTGANSFRDEVIPPVPMLRTTPGSSGELSAPSTGSSRHSWQGEEVGLAGPKSKKLDLSGEKLEWIEGMMKQARTVSSGSMALPRSDSTSQQHDGGAESRSESRSGMTKKPDFGDLGKVGGTKRIFLRGGKDH